MGHAKHKASIDNSSKCHRITHEPVMDRPFSARWSATEMKYFTRSRAQTSAQTSAFFFFPLSCMWLFVVIFGEDAWKAFVLSLVFQGRSSKEARTKKGGACAPSATFKILEFGFKAYSPTIPASSLPRSIRLCFGSFLKERVVYKTHDCWLKHN